MDNFSPLWTRKAHTATLAFFGAVMHFVMLFILAFKDCRGEAGAEGGGEGQGDQGGGAGAGAGAGATDWTATVDPEVRPIVAMKGWKTPSDVIKSYASIEKLVGLEKIPAPRKGKDGNYEPGEIERVMGALGLPKDPKEYKPSANFKLPEGSQIDEKFLSDFQAKAHKAGLLPHQYAFVMDELSSVLQRGDQAQKAAGEKAYNESSAALRAKWGMAFDEKMKTANMVLKGFADPKKAQEIVSKYGNDPVIVELLANVGENLSEDALSKAGQSGVMMTPEAATLEIKKVMADSNHPYFKADHPDHNFWVDKMTQLYKMAGA